MICTQQRSVLLQPQPRDGHRRTVHLAGGKSRLDFRIRPHLKKDIFGLGGQSKHAAASGQIGQPAVQIHLFVATARADQIITYRH